MYITWILSKIGSDDLGAGGDLQNFEASKSVDICWPWSFRRNWLTNLITLHKHRTHPHLSWTRHWKFESTWKNLLKTNMWKLWKDRSVMLTFSFCWSGSNCWHCYRLDTPWKIYSWNPNMEVWKMTFPFQFGDFLGSSRQFSVLYWLADLKSKRQIAPQIPLPHHQLSL